MDPVIRPFKQSIFDSSVKELGMDALDLGIDSILENEVLRQIPLVRLFVAAAETGLNIRDRNAIRNTYAFIVTLNDGSIDSEKVDRHKAKLDSDRSFAEEELGRVLVILDSILDVEKSKLLARLYRAYVEEAVDWDQFCELSEAMGRIFLADIKLLRDINEGAVTDTTQCDAYRADRLAAMGLVSLSVKSMVAVPGSDALRMRNFVAATSFGSLFCKLTV
ncbi:hypothetical protein [Adlercreutzia caecimuris]|uniref:hypothetical protein n=1 Tax=Adlercreutzia caecimuris TaxID=671266 RepID=UPI001C3F0430|nr:hypothetical protein [Adlercreutzia caecimuris]